METNEKLKTALLQETGKAMVEMLTELEKVKEGDLQTLEQKVLTVCLALGRSMMESIAGEGEERKARRDGDCGHRQRLVGMRPKHLRKARGWTQEDVAERAGITPRYLIDIEHGRYGPSFEVLHNLATALGVPLKELFNFSEP